MTTINSTMNAAQTLKAVLGLKKESVVIATDSDWVLAIQNGDMDKEIVLEAAIPATCFELGFKNKMKLSNFIAGKADEAMLRVGEAYLHFHYEGGDLSIDYGRTVGGYDNIFDTRTIEESKIVKFLDSLKTHVVSF